MKYLSWYVYEMEEKKGEKEEVEYKTNWNIIHEISAAEAPQSSSANVVSATSL